MLYNDLRMSYLRPHREIRELKWSDFSDDLGYIHLSGNRNKSGKNRIVPVPIYILENYLLKDNLITIYSQTLQDL